MSDLPGEGYLYRYNALLKKLLSAKGGEVLHEGAADLVSALVLELDRPEWYYLADTKLFEGGGTQLGGAGTTTWAVLNPTNSGLIVVVLGVILSFSVQDTLISYYDVQAGGVLGVQGRMVARDTRPSSGSQANNRTTAVQASQAAAAPNGSGFGRFVLPANTPSGVNLIYPRVLGPGQAAQWAAATAGTAVSAIIFGYERPAEASELT